MAGPEPTQFTLGIVGAGLMGGGIAQVSAQAGIRTLIFDTNAGAAVAAKQNIDAILQRLVAKGKILGDDAVKALANIEPADSLSALAVCNIVIEAIVENLDAKKETFRSLETVVSSNCVLATNTSSLSVTSIAAACRLPGRVGGFHFFSPVPLMRVVEVIDGVRTESRVGEMLTALANRIGHTPVRAQDTPGFIVNHAGRGYGTEALRILGESVATFHAIDRILCEGAGFRMGPFELLDLTGLDISQPVMESIYHQYYEEPRFRPSPLLLQRRQAGLLGRKTGIGFYQYVDAKIQRIQPLPVPAARPTGVWISGIRADAHKLVSAIVGELGGNLDTGERPAPDSLCVVTPIGTDATTCAVEEHLDARRTVAIDTLFGINSHRTLMATPVTTELMREAALGLFQADRIPASLIRDSAGFVAQRVIAHIVNIACDIAQQGVATPGDIDQAVTLGLGYRQGPLAMGDTIGPAKILTILETLQNFYGDPRYRPSPWLKRRARLGISLLTTDIV